MNTSPALKLPAGIWRHNKSGQRYCLMGVGSLMQDIDDFHPLLKLGSARFSENKSQPLLIWLATGLIRPGGQWVVDSLDLPLNGVEPGEPLVFYADAELQVKTTERPQLWVRPVFGPAGWLAPYVNVHGNLTERFTFEIAAAPWLP